MSSGDDEPDVGGYFPQIVWNVEGEGMRQRWIPACVRCMKRVVYGRRHGGQDGPLPADVCRCPPVPRVFARVIWAPSTPNVSPVRNRG